MFADMTQEVAEDLAQTTIFFGPAGEPSGTFVRIEGETAAIELRGLDCERHKLFERTAKLYSLAVRGEE